MNFADLGLSDELLKAVDEAGYTEPTPIQASAIPSVLMMRDIIGVAQTGTGKTASFVLPMIDILAHGRSRARMPRSLILEPTRELAAQVAENFEKYGQNHKLNMALLIGGVSMGDQLKALEKGVDVLIATPGRLMDLFDRGKILLNGCELLVIDEADRMLDMGFIPDIETICSKLPATRQTLLFSATMPGPIKKLADRFLSNPKHIEVARPATAATNIDQRLIRVTSRTKKARLRALLEQEKVQTAIVFCNRKTTVRDLNKDLHKRGFSSGEIHGDMDQSARIAELNLFKEGKVNILVASDVAARGLDVKGVSHVFNYDCPWHPDDYVHRIGRTGRAGANGIAYTFVTPEDEEALDNIEKLIGTTIDRSHDIAVPAETSDAPAHADSNDARPSPDRERKARRSGARRADSRQSEEAPVTADAPAPTLEKAPRPRRDRKSSEQATPPAAPEHAVPSSSEEAGRNRTPARVSRPKEPSKSAVSEKAARPPQPGDDDWNGPVPSFLNTGV